MSWLVLSAVTDNASDGPMGHQVRTRNAPNGNRDVFALLKRTFRRFLNGENRADTNSVFTLYGLAVFWREQMETSIPVVIFVADNYLVADLDVAKFHTVGFFEYGFHCYPLSVG